MGAFEGSRRARLTMIGHSATTAAVMPVARGDGRAIDMPRATVPAAMPTPVPPATTLRNPTLTAAPSPASSADKPEYGSTPRSRSGNVHAYHRRIIRDEEGVSSPLRDERPARRRSCRRAVTTCVASRRRRRPPTSLRPPAGWICSPAGRPRSPLPRLFALAWCSSTPAGSRAPPPPPAPFPVAPPSPLTTPPTNQHQETLP